MALVDNFTNDWAHWVVMGLQVLFTILFFIYMPLFIRLSRVEPLRSRFPEWTIIGNAGSFLIFTCTTIGIFLDHHRVTSCTLTFLSAINVEPFVLLPPLFRVSSLWFYLGWNKAKLTKTKTWYQDYDKLFTFKYQALLFLCNLIFFYALFVLTQLLIKSEEGGVFFGYDCVTAPGHQLVYPRILAFLVTALPMLYYLIDLRNVSDTYNIRNECIILLLAHIPIFWLYSFRASPSFYHHFPGYFHPRFSYQVFEIFMFLVSVVVQVHVGLGERVRMKRAGSDTNVSFEAKDLAKKLGSKTRREVLELVLGSPILVHSFVGFCERSFCVENILFVIDVQRFRDLEVRAKFEGAKIIIEHYFLKESPLLINLDAGVMERVLEAAQQETGQMILKNVKLFDEAYICVFEQLLRDPFQRWTSTSEFEEALCEMVKRDTSHSKSNDAGTQDTPSKPTSETHRKVSNGTVQTHGFIQTWESRGSESRDSTSANPPEQVHRRSLHAPDAIVLEEIEF